MMKFVFVGIAICATAAVARAQSPDFPPYSQSYIDRRSGLTLADAVTAAVRDEPTVRAARADVEAARGMRVQAGLRPNPVLSMQYRGEPGGSDNQTMIDMEWPLELFRRSARIAVADRETEVAQYSAADRARMLAAEVRTRYGRAAAEARNLAIAESVADSARRALELLRQRVESGAIPPLERDLQEVELRRLEAERLASVGRVETAMFELKRAIGLPVEAQLALRNAIEELVPPPRAAEAGAPSNDVVASRPDVQESDARVRAAQGRLELARAEGRMDMSLQGGYTRMDSGFPQRGFSESGSLERVRGVFHYVSGSAMITIPLTNRNQGASAAAEAETRAAAARLEAAQLSARSEIAAAASRDAQLLKARGVMEDAVRLARQNLDVVRRTYELGRATASDVLAEQRRYLEIENAYTTILLNSFEARTALQAARGELP